MVQFSFLVGILAFAESFSIMTSAFVLKQTPTPTSSTGTGLFSKKGAVADEVANQHAFSVGTLVEFEEKKRVHAGTIQETSHKSNGGARYDVVDSDGKHYDIRDKAVHFAIPAPTSPKAAEQLFDEFCKVQEASEKKLQSLLDINPEILELAWEEAAEDTGDEEETVADHHLLTPSGLIELVHSHSASAIEKYMAWKLLRTEISHIYFKEIKDHGRVVSFKAKDRKAVDASRELFCNTHDGEDEYCNLMP